MEITIGRIVIYKLSEQAAKEITRRRTDGVSIAERIKSAEWPLGAQAHIGSPVQEGQEFPMIVVATWSPGVINGQVLLDGSDTYWAGSVKEGDLPGTWHWPPRI